MLKKKGDYEVGEVLVCRKYLKGKLGKCSVNFEYSVKKVNDGSVVLKEIRGNTSFEQNLDVVKRHFIHSYCRTCHSFQGSSISDKITVLDWRFFWASRKWIYTAVTRATELKNVVFYDPKEASADYDEELLNKYLDKKVQNYKNKITNMDEQLQTTTSRPTG